MIFDNPDVLWLLIVLLPLIVVFGIWGWKAKKEAAKLFLLNLRRLKKKHIEKYILCTSLVVLLVLACALPEVASSSFATPDKIGEIVLLVDVSGSMAAREDIDSSSRLERVKEILYDLIDDIELMGDVKIALCAFTDIATSIVPLVGTEDYSYLKESIDKILEVTSVPGSDTRIGQSIMDVIDLPSLDITNESSDEEKLIILISDGEVFYLESPGIGTTERVAINNAVNSAVLENIKIITIGVGEAEGAKIPIYDGSGIFTGEYEKTLGLDIVSYLEEDVLIDIASRTDGKYFYEDDLGGLTDFIEANLSSAATSSTQVEDTYSSVALWFLLAAVPVWVILARRHLLR